MKNQNENAAVSDVTARMREEASILSLLNGQSVGVASVAKKLREFADSIDAAVSKTETTTPGNNAAMRDAVEAVVRAISEPNDVLSALLLMQADAKCKAALAEPPRNCDVGTAEEQEKRYIKLKIEHTDRITKCPHVGYSFFPDSLYWAQMPYESGVKREG